ncbi:MAG: four helix bundle protein, partial [Verrucomicrobiales bacterium]|nr:four helix bundle protein [Verrucomicrobiales bacterium]
YRSTLTDRILSLTLDAVERALEAAYTPAGPAKKISLQGLNLILEKLRFLWRVVHARRFLSNQQHTFVCLKLDEIGRMVGGWLRSLEGRIS